MFARKKHSVGLTVAIAVLAVSALLSGATRNIPKESPTETKVAALSAIHAISAHDAKLETRLAAEAEVARLEAERKAAEEQRLAQAAKVRTSRSKAVRGTVQPFSGDLSALVDRLAMCESGMNPRTNTGNGFYGAFQFMLRTWQRFRPGNPINYSYEEQKAVIMQFFPVSSWRSQFPACSRKLGVA